jgi:hypothetical protein
VGCALSAHDDRDPSLSVGVGCNDRILVKCHAGCTAQEIVAALSLRMRDLYPASCRTARRTPARRRSFPWRALDPNSGLRRTERHIAGALHAHMDEHGASEGPAHSILVTDSGYSKAAVIRALRAIVAAGFLRKIPGGPPDRLTLYQAVNPLPRARRSVVSERPIHVENLRRSTKKKAVTAFARSENAVTLELRGVRESPRTGNGSRDVMPWEAA